MRPQVASKTWAGVPPIEEAWSSALMGYLGAYGPATPDNFSAWLFRGTIPKRRIKSWFADLSDRLATVDMDGEKAFIPADQLDDLAAAKASRTLRLLPGFDQWVLGPGTDDGHVTPAARRSAVSKTAGWIAPTVVVGGFVRGTWALDGDRVAISWFREAGRSPTKAIKDEVARLSAIVDRELQPQVALV